MKLFSYIFTFFAGCYLMQTIFSVERGDALFSAVSMFFTWLFIVLAYSVVYFEKEEEE